MSTLTALREERDALALSYAQALKDLQVLEAEKLNYEEALRIWDSQDQALREALKAMAADLRFEADTVIFRAGEDHTIRAWADRLMRLATRP